MHGLCKDLTNNRYGKLTVIKYYPKHNGKRNIYYCDCECDCGGHITTPASSLVNGKRTNCGCESRFHGIKDKRLKNIWQSMKQRCNNPKSKSYNSYGGRGIKVCSEWEHSFKDFYYWAINNGYDENLSIERIDVNKGYCPDNCKWIPIKEQAYNKQNTVRFEVDGETRTAIDLANEHNIYKDTLVSRVKNYGMSLSDAINWSKNKKQYSKVRNRAKKYNYKGEMLTLKEIADICGINKNTLYERIHVYHWDEERAFTKKVMS